MKTDFNIVNSVFDTIDNEAIRTLKTTSGMWKPGYNDDKYFYPVTKHCWYYGD